MNFGSTGFKFQHLHLSVWVTLGESLKHSVSAPTIVKWRFQYLFLGLLSIYQALSIAPWIDEVFSKWKLSPLSVLSQ